ncbi:MAG TPA: hypothetical protein VK498_13160 [Ferruginibacter sp.]|nr:hypothetical protein [Ferruginibacter sp.]
MKKTFFIIIATLGLLGSCKKADNSSNSISPTIVTNTVISGSWRITYYWDTNHEETSSFSGYSFTFGNGNALIAVKGTSTITGTWTTGTDDSQTKLILSFSTPSSFMEISDDWHITEVTSTRIKLQDISGGNGGTDYLTFEKN